MDDRELMSIRADTVFTYDAGGRLLLTNEPCAAARQPAPRLLLGWTATGYVLRLGAAVPDDLADEIERIVARQPPVSDLWTPPAALAEIRAVLARRAPIAEEGGGPAYRFPASLARPAEAVRLTEANRELVRETYRWLYDEFDDWQPAFAVLRDGAAVSVCFSARWSATAAEAGVDTLVPHRGYGHAAAVTAAWGMAVRETGRVPIYSTGWKNLASQGVAHRLGLIMFGADSTLT
jgi:hypothetical protein